MGVDVSVGLGLGLGGAGLAALANRGLCIRSVRCIKPVQHCQRLVDITRGSHGSEMVFGVPRRQRMGAELLHQFVHGQTPALRERLEALRRVVW